jgi:hypothetical protein
MTLIDLRHYASIHWTFTRDANGIGQATVVANIADPRSDAVEDLYAEDSD